MRFTTSLVSLAAAAGMALTVAPAASAAVEKFHYDQQVITSPVTGVCYPLTSSGGHKAFNETGRIAIVFIGPSCADGPGGTGFLNPQQRLNVPLGSVRLMQW